MTAITISREIGCGGDWIAEETAKRLGYRLVNKHTIEHIFLQYGFVKFDEMYENTNFWTRFDPNIDEMVGMLNKFTVALAAHGNVVLVGRGGFAMLKNFADVLNVRLHAPLAMRIEQVLLDEKLPSKAAAEEFVKENDRARQNFLEAAYGNKWNATGSFDLVIDTSKITAEIAVEWLVDTIIRIAHQNKKGKLTTASLEIDPVMASAVAEALEQMPGYK